MHTAFYDTRPQTGAVVHLHSSHSVTWSMMPDVDPENALPPLTPYSIMQLGKVKLLPFFVPGDPAMGEAVCGLAVGAPQSSWPTTGRLSLVRTSKGPATRSENSSTQRNLAMLTLGQPVRALSDDQVQSVVQAFDIDWDRWAMRACEPRGLRAWKGKSARPARTERR